MRKKVPSVNNMEFSRSRSRSRSRSGDESSVDDAEIRGRGIGARRSRRGRGRGRGNRIGSPCSELPQHRRGRRAGRGRGAGRGRAQPAVNRGDTALMLVCSREDNINSAIDTLSLERAKEIIRAVARKEPSLLLDIMQPAAADDMEHRPQGSEVPDWCVCSRCRQMPTEDERVCCCFPPERCTSVNSDFRVVCLDEVVLEVANRYRMDFLAVGQGNYAERNRHAAYRQFILWQHGRLGAGNRRVIPSCCVWAIRDKYPDPNGLYTGFLAGRLG